MTTATIRNGVNVSQLIETVEAVKRQPELARFSFRARTVWETGGRSRTTIKGFYGAGQEDTSREAPFTLIGDEPPVFSEATPDQTRSRPSCTPSLPA